MFAILLLFAGLLAIISIVTLVINPTVGLFVLLLCKPIIDTAYFKQIIFGMPLTQIVGAVIPMILLFHITIGNGYRSLRKMPMKNIWVLYASYILFFSLVVVYNGGIKNGLEVFFRHINAFVGFYMMQALCDDDAKIRKLFYVLIVAGVFPMLTTFYQAITGVDWSHAGITQLQELGELTRTSGLYFHVMTVRYYAYQTIIALLLFAAYFTRTKKVNYALTVFGLLAAFVLFKTYSKSGLLVLVISLFIWVVLRKNKKAMLGMLVLGLLTIPFVYQDIVSVFSAVFMQDKQIAGLSQTEQALRGRLPLWIKLYEEWNQFGLMSKIFSTGHIKTGAHNDYIQMMFHGGIIGVVIYLTLLVTAGIAIIKNLRTKVQPLSIAALILYISWLIDTVGLVPSGYPSYSWLVWGIIGLSLRQGYEQKYNRFSEAEKQQKDMDINDSSPRILRRKKIH